MSNAVAEPVLVPLPETWLDVIAQRILRLVASQMTEAPPRPLPASPYLSVSEAAEYLRCKPHRIYDLLSARRIERYKDGSRVLIKRADLDTYIAGIEQSRSGARHVHRHR